MSKVNSTLNNLTSKLQHVWGEAMKLYDKSTEYTYRELIYNIHLQMNNTWWCHYRLAGSKIIT